MSNELEKQLSILIKDVAPDMKYAKKCIITKTHSDSTVDVRTNVGEIKNLNCIGKPIVNDDALLVPVEEDWTNAVVVSTTHGVDGKDGKDGEKMLDEFKGVANLTYWYEKGVDIIDKGVSKASGIKDVLDILDLKKEESISFGDGENDLEMMSATGISVAMGNAVDDIKEKATYVTDSIDNDGLAKALEKYFN